MALGGEGRHPARRLAARPGGTDAATATAQPPPDRERRRSRSTAAGSTARSDPEAVFVALHGESEWAFWLDGGGDPRSRFSFIGDAAGPHAATVSYDVATGELEIGRGGRRERRHESVFEHLRSELRRLRPEPAGLPFEFDCGFVGYLGYELKAECGGEAAHASELPDAALLFADRVLAFDREEGCVYLVCLAADAAEAERWFEQIEAALAAVDVPAAEPPPEEAGGTVFRLLRSDGQHRRDVAECRRLLREGETYEVCLTNQLVAEVEPDPLALYRRLRRRNPAPYSAYLRCGEVAIVSSSPERFLHLDRAGAVEVRPMKGTAARDADPEADARLARGLRASEKDRAENLMITDLLRNDLGAACLPGTIEVPQLIGLESYETVHQLVSVVRGRLRPEVDAIGATIACFPPGSMTGAPKRRTMEIIDRLEGEARGAYSGALGYFGLGGGCDLSVVIRTVVLAAGRARIGVGGGIVLQSDPHEELRESLLKGRAPMNAVDVGARVELEAPTAESIA